MNQRENYLIRERLATSSPIPVAVDVHFKQAFDNPTLFMESIGHAPSQLHAVS